MIAMNEEANLPRTLESVRWADEIIVVDSGSKDRTLEIARSFGAKTSYHAFGGHGEQKNVALDLCTSEWILLLDADEVLWLGEVISSHAKLTGSTVAAALLADWPIAAVRFSRVMPRDYRRVLSLRAEALARGIDADEMIMEASHG